MDWSRGLLVHYCDVFMSCLDSYSDGTQFTAEDQLMSRLCKMLNFSKSVLNKKKKPSVSWMAFFSKVHFSTIFLFRLTIPLREHKSCFQNNSK